MNLIAHFSLMDFSIIFLSLIMATIPIICRFKIKFEEALPTAISSIVIWLYFFGIAGILKVGFYSLLIVIAASTLICLYFSSEYKKVLKNTLTPGFFIYIIWLFLVFLNYSDLNLTHHDDFSHWGLASKNTYILDAIAVGDKANTIFQDYPPGTALLSYFLLKVKGVFSEPIILFGMSIWGYAVIAYPIKYLEWRNYKAILIYALVGFFIPVAFNLDQNSPMDYHAYLMVDYLHALIFGYALILATSINQKYTSFDLIKLIAVVFSLVLIKQAGVFLSLVILALVLYNVSRASIDFGDLARKGGSKLNCLNIGRGKFLVAAIALSFLVAYLSWKIFLSLNKVAEANVIHNYSAFIRQLLVLNFDLPERSFKVMELYLNALYRTSLMSGPIKLSFVGFYGLIIFGVYIFFKSIKNKNSRHCLFGNSLIIFAFLAAYMIGHLILYVVVLSDGEAYGLSSFLRYLLYFTVGIFLLIFGISIKYGAQPNGHSYKYVTYLLILILLLSVNDFTKNGKAVDIDGLKKEVVENLTKDSESNNHYLSKWAQLELGKVRKGDFAPAIDVNVIESLRKIKAINDDKFLSDKMRLLEQIAIDNNSLYVRGKSLCFLEGRGGSSYGYALMLRNKLVPVHIDRIQSHQSRTSTEKVWHDSLFILAAKSCAQIVLIEPNDVIEKYYNSFFSSPMKNYGLYDLIWIDDTHVKLSLKDCRACD